MSRIAHHRMTAALLVATSATVLTGCTTGEPSAPGTATVTVTAPASPVPSTTSASATPTPSPPTATPSSTTRVDPDAPAGQCADSALDVTVQHDPEGDGAGQRGAFVVLRNIGSSRCALEGTPGLSLVGGGDGTQIGAPATRITQGAALVVLAPGADALAAVTYTYVDAQGGNFNDGDGHDTPCRARPADGYRVYPPHSYRAYFTASATYACSTDVHWITVGVVKPASAYPYFTPRS